MKTFLKQLLVRNLRYKVIALVLAVTIWYSVTERSFKDKTVSPVQIEFHSPENFLIHTELLRPVLLRLNLPEYLINEYELSEKHFWVKIVIGPQSLSEEQLVNKEDYTDKIGIPLHSDMVQIRLPERESRQIFVDAITPKILEVTISLITKRVPVVPRFRGEPQKGYVVGEPELSSRWIELTGSQEALDLIDKIELQEIDLTGLTGDEEKERARSTQVEISRQKLDALRVHAVRDGDRKIYVTVPVEPAIQARTISGIDVLPKNAPPAESGATIIFNPPSVEIQVEGRPSVLEQIAPEQLSAEVDLTGFGLGEHQIPLKIRGLPEGVKVTGRSVNTIQVRIEGTLPTNILAPEIVR